MTPIIRDAIGLQVWEFSSNLIEVNNSFSVDDKCIKALSAKQELFSNVLQVATFLMRETTVNF